MAAIGIVVDPGAVRGVRVSPGGVLVFEHSNPRAADTPAGPATLELLSALYVGWTAEPGDTVTVVCDDAGDEFSVQSALRNSTWSKAVVASVADARAQLLEDAVEDTEAASVLLCEVNPGLVSYTVGSRDQSDGEWRAADNVDVDTPMLSLDSLAGTVPDARRLLESAGATPVVVVVAGAFAEGAGVQERLAREFTLPILCADQPAHALAVAAAQLHSAPVHVAGPSRRRKYLLIAAAAAVALTAGLVGWAAFGGTRTPADSSPSGPAASPSQQAPQDRPDSGSDSGGPTQTAPASPVPPPRTPVPTTAVTTPPPRTIVLVPSDPAIGSGTELGVGR